MKKYLKLIAITCTCMWAFNAQAQFEKAKDAVEYRQAAFDLIASHFGRMAPVAKGKADFDAKSIKQNVDLLKTLSDLPFAAFDKGTEGGNAKPEIWSDPEGFAKAHKNFQVAIANLSAAADEGDLAKFKASFGKVGQTCKSCHQDYRKR